MRMFTAKIVWFMFKELQVKQQDQDPRKESHFSVFAEARCGITVVEVLVSIRLLSIRKIPIISLLARE